MRGDPVAGITQTFAVVALRTSTEVIQDSHWSFQGAYHIVIYKSIIHIFFMCYFDQGPKYDKHVEIIWVATTHTCIDIYILRDMPTAVDSFGTRWPHTHRRWLRTHRFSELLFDRPEPQNIGKNTVLRDFSTGSRTAAAYSFF